MALLPTLYKARRVPTKQPVCLVCVERTRGKTTLVRMSHGVTVWLCQGHASPSFQSQRNGRDFVLTLMQLWQAAGCLTAARHKALDAHLRTLRPRPSRRPLPGSYAWPQLRDEAERRYAAGAGALDVRRALVPQPGPARPPSVRTFRRWQQEQRWRARCPHAPP